MNWVGVTCLSCVASSGNLKSLPPYFAETSFRVPISLWSAFAPSFGSSARQVVTVTPSATTATIHRDAIVAIWLPSEKGIKLARPPTPKRFYACDNLHPRIGSLARAEDAGHLADRRSSVFWWSPLWPGH